MAEKGDKAKLYEVAMRLYVEGQSLTAIESTLGVSRQTLAAWKADAKIPGQEYDEWDKARKTKRTYSQRMRALLDRELDALEASAAGSLNNVSYDCITKLGSLVVKFEATEAQSAAGYDKGKIFLENIQWMVSWLRENDPEGLKALAADFDAMTMKFKLGLMNGGNA